MVQHFSLWSDRAERRERKGETESGREHERKRESVRLSKTVIEIERESAGRLKDFLRQFFSQKDRTAYLI